MSSLVKILTSSVGQKFIMAISGLGITGFLVMHLVGNANLYSRSSLPYNAFVAKLWSWGNLVYVAEVGLVGIFLLHIVMAFGLKKNHSDARPVGYQMEKTKGGPSRNTVSARNMIISGLVLMVFLIAHVWQFRFGPGVAQGYVTEVDGKSARDLHRLVVEVFQNPLMVALYVGAMTFLGFHLRHGFWSAFQSLGALTPKLSKAVSALAVFVAVALTFGFLFIPIYMYVVHGRAAS